MNDICTIARDKVVVRALEKADLQRYRAIRLNALQRAPMSFGSTFEEENAYSDTIFARRLEQVDGNAIFGAFHGEELLGIAGHHRHERRTERHRGTLASVYVEPQARGLKLGEALVQKVIDHARGMLWCSTPEWWRPTRRPSGSIMRWASRPAVWSARRFWCKGNIWIRS